MSTGDASDAIGPDDPRYRAVVDKRFNKRFVAKPDYVRLACSTDDVISAVADAVRDDRRLVVTSGGHCLEGFVSDPEVKVIVDVSPMKGITSTPNGGRRRAGGCHGGRDVPGAPRPLVRGRSAGRVSRHRHGWARGRRRVRFPLPPARPRRGLPVRRRGRDGGCRRAAARRRRDPRAVGSESRAVVGADRRRGRQLRHRDPLLVSLARRVRRRSRRAAAARAGIDHDVPRGVELERPRSRVLPAPGPQLRHLVGADQRRRWALRLALDIARAAPKAAREDRRPRRQHRRRRRRAAGGRLPRGARGRDPRRGQPRAGADVVARLRAEPVSGPVHVSSGRRLHEGEGRAPQETVHRSPDRRRVRPPDQRRPRRHGRDAGAGELRRRDQPRRARRDRLRPARRDPRHRLNSGWLDPRDEAKNLAWVRGFYRDLFADSGGVPVPGDAYAGAFINHPDPDLADPTLNTSGVPWHALYFRGGYARLQRVKARWDPCDVFRHALSIRGE